MVPRPAIVLLVLLVFVVACASEQIAQEGTEEPRQSGEVEPSQPTAEPTITVTSVPTATPTPTIGPTPIKTPAPTCVGNEESDKPCEPREVGDFDFFSASLGNTSATPSVEDVLEQGILLSGASPVHLAFRGTAQSDTVRCEWRGVARTLEQPDRKDRCVV